MTTVLLVVALALLVALLVAVALLLRAVGGRTTTPDPEVERLREQAAADLADRREALDTRDQQLTEQREQVTRQREQVTQQREQVTQQREQVAAERERLDAQRRQHASAQEQAAAALEDDRLALEAERLAALERTAGLSADAARAELVGAITSDAERRAALRVRDVEAEAHELAEVRARAIVADAVQRVASDQTAESVVSVMALPSDDYKGRIIGREGRNIRAFEHVTGVDLVIDDTPDAVLLSCFDPVRREVGRLTLEKLVADGRFSPSRIEEVHEQALAQVLAGSTRAGQDAVTSVGLREVHPELVELLGRLRLRTSYGQNVLAHLVETAHLAGLMATELRMDPTLTKRAAFLHDIGKALTHEVQGTHAAVGADLARRLGEPEEVVHAIAAHHDEVPPQTIEAVLTQASDSCSGSRPGARRESLESYVQRLERLEGIAAARKGVERAYAVQAGREVRVMVVPEQIDDTEALVLAQSLARQIEDELTYPGQVRVTVVRETRASGIAR